MINNYLKIAYRNLIRHKAYSFINIAGLGVGIACCMMLCLYVQDELSFESFHRKAKHIYRVTTEFKQQGEINRIAQSTPPMAAALVQDYPEIRHAVRFNQTGPRNLFTYQDKHLYETGGYYADSNVFAMFTYPLAAGNPQNALNDPASIVISQEIAQRYFGSGDALGKVIKVELDSTYQLKVTGVLADIPYNTQIRPNFLLSFELIRNNRNNWWAYGYYTYVETRPDVKQADLERKMHTFIKRHLAADDTDNNPPPVAHLQPLLDIHLDSSLGAENGSINDMAYIYLFGVLALFIITIACINFMNLSTARSQDRAREVGVRKVVGAEKMQLVRQFLSESLVLSVLGLALSIILVEVFMPAFNTLSGKHLSLNFINNWLVPSGFLVLTILVGISAGIYPAFFLSSFRPVEVLKGKFSGGSRGVTLRRTLVVLQFSISIGLIVGTAVVYSQMNFIRDKKLGFDKEQVIVVPLQGEKQYQKYRALRLELLQTPDIRKVAIGSSVPGSRGWWTTGIRPEGIPAGDDRTAVTFQIDYDFMSTLGTTMVAGRDFSTRFSTDSTEAFIINEAAVKSFGWGSPAQAIGKKIEEWNGGSKHGRVVGVVKDFHYQSLHQQIDPAIFHIMPQIASQVVVRVQPGKVKAALAFMQKKWTELDAQHPFEYTFLDENLHKQYGADQTLGKIFGIFSMLAIFIACLGLYGLAAFTTAQRTKEIGIRKVLGASASNIVVMLSKEFVRLVLVAMGVAIPVAWFGMNHWLQDFAYRTPLHWWLFAAAGIIALLIALMTVSFQAVKAAIANPVSSLRSE